MSMSISPRFRPAIVPICLGLCGAVGAAVGATLLWDPMVLAPVSGLSGTERVDYVNEARAPGGALLLAAGAMVLALWKDALRMAALWLASALYLGYGLSRALSVLLDGMPKSALMSAMWIELALGGLALLCALNMARSRA
ncbi:MAG: DUF4345 family protein [Marinibacterium sp.]